MSENKRLFPYEKTIVLNALYDALDTLSFAINSSNSRRGILTVSSLLLPELGGRIAVTPLQLDAGVSVEVFPLDCKEDQSEWISALFDETETLFKLIRFKEKV